VRFANLQQALAGAVSNNRQPDGWTPACGNLPHKPYGLSPCL